ncbi:unnamed protein product, partial [marine sediment metagenome]
RRHAEYAGTLSQGIWSTWWNTVPPKPKPVNLKAHAMGHHFGEDLVCTNPGCGMDFGDHNKYPNCCPGVLKRAGTWTGDGFAPDPKLRRLCDEHGIRIIDVARIALVSPQTVSNALTRAKGIRNQTRLEMIWFVKELLRRKGVNCG